MGQPTDRPKVNVRQAKNTSIFPMIWVLFLLETINSYQNSEKKSLICSEFYTFQDQLIHSETTIVKRQQKERV